MGLLWNTPGQGSNHKGASSSPRGSPGASRQRAPATCRRRHVTETEPTTPRASHPARAHHETAPGNRRTSSFVCGIEKCHVGDRDHLFGSLFSTSTGHRKRNPRAALRNARALPSGASLSARQTASEGAHSSQRAGSTSWEDAMHIVIVWSTKLVTQLWKIR